MKKTILIVFQIILGKLLFAQSTNSLSFLGSNAYVVLDALAQPMSQTTDFTVEFWMKANRSDNTNSPRVALFAINPWVQGVPENKLLIIMGGSFSQTGNLLILEDVGGSAGIEITSATVVGDGACHHIAYVKSGSTGRLFVDGVLEGTHTSNVSLAASDRYSIGQEWDYANPSDFYHGEMDDLRVWTVARTAAQIESTMHIELAGTEVGLLACYDFNQGIPGGNNAGVTVLNDKTANSLHGQLFGFALTGSVSNWISDSCLPPGCPNLPISAGPDAVICAGRFLNLQATPGFDTYQWSPAATLDNPNSPNPVATPAATTTYYLVATNLDSVQTVCSYTDSVTVTVNPSDSTFFTFTRCANEPIDINGELVNTDQVFIQIVSNIHGCDSVITTYLNFLPLPTRSESIEFCAGESVVIGGVNYNQSGTVVDTIPATGPGCDTVATYTLIMLPLPTRSETIEFCPGETINIGGNAYTLPGTVVNIIPTAAGCDTVVTYTLQYLTPAPSTVTIACPEAVNIAILPGAGPTIAHYNLPVADSDCPCPGLALELTAGLPSGSAFPPGTTEVCYAAQDSCGNSAACCFQVIIREAQACDIKEIGCMKYELLTITADAEQNRTYRIRVTNNCANKLIYTAIQLPDGVAAIDPANLSAYTAESGRGYEVRNPNYSPFYSIRFKSAADSIANVQSEIFQYTLPAQSAPVYIHITSRLATQVFYEAHLNTFNCPIGITPAGDKAASRAAPATAGRPAPRLFPNPTAGELFAGLSAWSGEKVQLQVFNAQGQQVHQLVGVAGEAPFALRLPDGLANGLYTLQLLPDSGERQALRFVLQR
ncbi:MAG: HYR domain-containing protein [Saprospirales bacterium]|nr:HYR domain-containing protein [Saprospirales bacterium]